MNDQVYYLALVTLFTALTWLPHISYIIIKQGPWEAFKNPQDRGEPLSPWAARSKAASQNAYENLIIFGLASLAVLGMKLQSEATLLAAQIYLGARVIHFFVYLAGVPVLRTLAFLVGFGAQIFLIAKVLGW